MTFEDFEKKHLGGFGIQGRALVRMGWNARGGDHIPDATKMVRGDVALMGDVTDEDGTTYHKALVVQFATVEDFRAAMKAGQCRFTVFGGEG